MRIYSCCRCRCAAPQLLCIFISQSQAGLWCHDIVGVVAGTARECVRVWTMWVGAAGQLGDPGWVTMQETKRIFIG
jgi:hypothetical protein